MRGILNQPIPREIPISPPFLSCLRKHWDSNPGPNKCWFRIFPPYLHKYICSCTRIAWYRILQFTLMFTCATYWFRFILQQQHASAYQFQANAKAATAVAGQPNRPPTNASMRNIPFVFTDRNYPCSPSLRDCLHINPWRHHLCNGPWLGSYQKGTLVSACKGSTNVLLLFYSVTSNPSIREHSFLMLDWSEYRVVGTL